MGIKARQLFLRRKNRTRHTIKSCINSNPRLSVFRSSKNIYAQIIEDGKEIEFYLMFLCSGLSKSKHEFSIHEKYENIYTKFIISQEEINKLEAFNNINTRTIIDISWFSVFNEYLISNNLEYVLNKFNLNIGDFIRTAKEASELSIKLYNIFNIDEFKQINKLFNNKLIQKTML